MSARITLILGGARSGKSARAEALASIAPGPTAYVATYHTGPDPAQDPEMQERLHKHRARRPAHWITVENQFDLHAAFAQSGARTVVLDCLTLWLSHLCEGLPEPALLNRLEASLLEARRLEIDLFIVSNELGMGLVPSSPEGRAFRDLCGRANQLVARLADRVEFVIAGLPLVLKGGETP